MYRLRFLVVSLLFIGACSCAPRTLHPYDGAIESPVDITGHQYLFIRPSLHTPLPWYRHAYEEALACAGAFAITDAAGFDTINWFKAQAIVRYPDLRLAKGLWTGPGNIWMDESQINDWDSVYHELLHEVMGAQHGHSLVDGGPDDPEFARCIHAGTRGE